MKETENEIIYPYEGILHLLTMKVTSMDLENASNS